MKILKKVLILIVTFNINFSFSQSGWQQLNPGTSTNFTFIQFLNESTGFVGAPLLRTTNGGVNWVGINTSFTPTGIFYIDINNGYASTGGMQGNGTIYKTTNGGLNWTNTNVPSNLATNLIYFFDVSTGYFAGSDGELIVIYKTTNGGNSWNMWGSVGDICFSVWVFNFFFVNSNEGYVNCQMLKFDPYAIYYERIERTINGGQTWTTYLNGPNPMTSRFEDISIPQPSTGFVLWGPDAGNDSILTYNGIFKYQANFHLNSIHCPSPLFAWVVGSSGNILATSNAGSNWNAQYSNVSTHLNEVYFVNNQTGYIVGNNGVILKTSSGGFTFYTVSGQIRFQDNNQPVNNGIVKALHYDRISDQIITVDSTNIQSNGTYNLIHIPPQDSLYIMAFENDEAQLVFVPTYYPSTTNWQNAAVLYPTGNLSNIDVLVYRINNTGGPYHIGGHIYINTGSPVIGLNNSVVYAKTGSDYKAYSISNGTGLYRVDSLSPSNYTLTVDRIGYAPITRPVLISSFSKDTIDITFNLVGVVRNGNIIPESYLLENNYPNPFNPVTNISFGFPKASFTKLTIFDILGREIVTLLNEKLEAGCYSIDWNAANYSSGIYFYRLESRQVGSSTDDFVQTKKMVLIK